MDHFAGLAVPVGDQGDFPIVILAVKHSLALDADCPATPQTLSFALPPRCANGRTGSDQWDLG
jgi:hypothetical protein